MGPGPQAGSEPSAAAPGGRRASGGLGESVWARAQSSPRFALQASGRRSPESGSKPEKIDLSEVGLEEGRTQRKQTQTSLQSQLSLGTVYSLATFCLSSSLILSLCFREEKGSLGVGR